MVMPLVAPGLLALVLAVTAVDGLSPVVATDATSVSSTESCLRSVDQMWLVSTRHLGCPDLDDPSTLDLDIRRYSEADGWQTSSLGEFLAQDAGFTFIYVHGNRYNWSDAFEWGWMMYHALASCSGDVPPMRFVIWSWPSDKIARPLRDLRVKADRADIEGLYFGWFISQLKPDTRLSMSGYSYGARIISGGLQLLGGGTVEGQQLEPSMRRNDLGARAVYMAPAIDSYGLYPGNEYGDSVRQLDRLLILYNSCDQVLRRYHLLDRCSRATSLGYTGLSVDGMGELAGRIEQFDAAPYVGRAHQEELYIQSGSLFGEICRIILWQDAVPAAQATP